VEYITCKIYATALVEGQSYDLRWTNGRRLEEQTMQERRGTPHWAVRVEWAWSRVPNYGPAVTLGDSWCRDKVPKLRAS